jgi:type I restriction enzyme S subunit
VLESMARGLFEEWFVRFRYPGHENQQITNATDGPIPDGWHWAQFGDVAAEIRNPVLPANVLPETRYIGLEHIPRRSITLNDFGRAKDVASLKLRFERGDVLFGKIRPYFHKVAWAPYSGVSSSDAIIYRARNSVDSTFVLLVASSDRFVAQAVQTSNGTKMPRANPSVLKAYRIASAPQAISKQFHAIAGPMIELAASLQVANERLAVARDLLLPRLISGELSISSAKRELEAAA